MLSALRSKWTIAVVIIVVLLGGLGYWKFGFGQREPVQAAFVTETVRKGELKVTVSATGSITGVAQAEIRPEVTGTVVKVPVSIGDKVMAGDPLIYLASDSLAEQVSQAKIDLDMAELKLKEMKNPASRATQSQLEIANERINQARLNFDRKVQDEVALEVRAPISGEINSLTAVEGQYLSSNSVIARIIDTSSLYMVFSVGEHALTSLKAGQHGSAVIGSNNVPREGEVTEIARLPRNSGSGLVYDIKLRLNPGLGEIRPGYSGIVNINTIGQGGELEIQTKGSVEAGTVADVRLKVGGDLKQLLVTNGNLVTANEVMARLENQDLTLAKHQAELEYTSARDSYDSLISPPVTATEAEIQSQELKVRQLELSLAAKQREAEKLVLRSPISGMIVARNVNVGDRVGSNGGASLITVADYSSMNLSINVDELDIGKLKVGQRAQVTVDALGGKVFPAEVSQIAPSGTVSQGVATFNVLLQIKETAGLISGMTGNAVILSTEKSGVLMVPLEAVEGSGEQAMVRVIKAGHPQPVRIKTGLANDTHIEVIEGLRQGDIVVAGTVSTAATALRGLGGGFGAVRMGRSSPGGAPHADAQGSGNRGAR